VPRVGVGRGAADDKDLGHHGANSAIGWVAAAVERMEVSNHSKVWGIINAALCVWY
jgi:hypothetical protein